ncbi:MAG: SDR family oxidoreductase [Gemmataceae bacterium]|nr:SDR family oxidoreductase [Gemmataceae bacterium]MDW8263836.1 SDR family oxidoreductase [Gemmataceae bacterium]
MPSGPVALVTGSGRRRIGACVAETLARRGYALAIHYRRSAADAEALAHELRQRGAAARTWAADLRDEAAVRTLIHEIVDHFGRLDVLVHCAALWESKPLEEVTADDVRRHLDTNTLATFLCCQHAGLTMVRQAEGGVIILLGDWAEARPYPHYAAYFASKGAIPALTRCFAVELGRRNPRVRVNAILPGPVMLPPDLPEAERHEAISATLVQREGRPENVAQAVWYLIDNDFVTGDCLRVDGGRTVWAQGF